MCSTELGVLGENTYAVCGIVSAHDHHAPERCPDPENVYPRRIPLLRGLYDGAIGRLEIPRYDLIKRRVGGAVSLPGTPLPPLARNLRLLSFTRDARGIPRGGGRRSPARELDDAGAGSGHDDVLW